MLACADVWNLHSPAYALSRVCSVAKSDLLAGLTGIYSTRPPPTFPAQTGIATRERDGMQLPCAFIGPPTPEETQGTLDLPGAGRVLQVGRVADAVRCGMQAIRA